MTDNSDSMDNRKFKIVQLKIFSVSCLLSLSLGVIVTCLQIKYFEHYPYFFDPVSYSLRNINLFVQLSQTNRLALALNEWLTYSKAPLRTVPLILFSPDLLSINVGYVATALPPLLLFLLVLGRTIYRRTSSIIYSLAVIFLFCSIPALWNLQWGLGTYWLDLPASLLVGTAAIALINFLETDSLIWLALFSTFSACATLCRYIAIAYVFVICMPIIAIYTLKSRFWSKSLRSFILPRLTTALLPLTALAGCYLVTQFSSNYEYYTVYGYALNKDRIGAFLFIVQFLNNSLFGLPLTILLLTVFLLNLLLARAHFLRHWQLIITAGWFAFSVVLFFSFLGSVEAFHSTVYAVPPIFFVAVSPLPWSRKNLNKQLRYLRSFLCIGLILFATFSIQQTLSQNFYLSTHPDPDAKALKKLDLELAQILVKESNGKATLSWQTYFDEYAEMPSVEAFYISGKLPISSKKRFTTHEAFWKGFYPGLDPRDVSSKVYEISERDVDLAVIFNEPSQAFKVYGTNNNPYSRTVAFDMAKRLPKDANWKRIASVDTERYGKLAAYRNLSRVGIN